MVQSVTSMTLPTRVLGEQTHYICNASANSAQHLNFEAFRTRTLNLPQHRCLVHSTASTRNTLDRLGPSIVMQTEGPSAKHGHANWKA